MPDNWEQKNTHTHTHTMITEQNKNRLKPLFLLCENDLGPVSAPYLDQLITIKQAQLGPVNSFTAYIYIYTGCLPQNEPSDLKTFCCLPKSFENEPSYEKCLPKMNPFFWYTTSSESGFF